MARQRSPGLIACPRAERRFFFLSYFFLAHTSSGLEQNFFFFGPWVLFLDHAHSRWCVLDGLRLV